MALSPKTTYNDDQQSYFVQQNFGIRHSFSCASQRAKNCRQGLCGPLWWRTCSRTPQDLRSRFSCAGSCSSWIDREYFLRRDERREGHGTFCRQPATWHAICNAAGCKIRLCRATTCAYVGCVWCARGGEGGGSGRCLPGVWYRQWLR